MNSDSRRSSSSRRSGCSWRSSAAMPIRDRSVLRPCHRHILERRTPNSVFVTPPPPTECKAVVSMATRRREDERV